jgi:hypothetical protein
MLKDTVIILKLPEDFNETTEMFKQTQHFLKMSDVSVIIFKEDWQALQKYIKTEKHRFITFCEPWDFYNAKKIQLQRRVLLEHPAPVCLCAYNAVWHHTDYDYMETYFPRIHNVMGLEYVPLASWMLDRKYCKNFKIVECGVYTEIATLMTLMQNSSSIPILTFPLFQYHFNPWRTDRSVQSLENYQDYKRLLSLTEDLLEPNLNYRYLTIQDYTQNEDEKK